MKIPPSPHCVPVLLENVFNADRALLDGGLAPRSENGTDWSTTKLFGERAYKGIPFALGDPDRPNVVLLSSETGEVWIAVDNLRASYLIFLHAAEDHPEADPFQPFPGGGVAPGNAIGDWVSDYVLVYTDGTETATRISRRFAIQQRHIIWGASPFAAVPAQGPVVTTSSSEDRILRRVATATYGDSERRTDAERHVGGESLWLYALPNPDPERPIKAIVLHPREERSVVYAITTTTLTEHPLRPGLRQKLRLTLPEGAEMNRLGELNADYREPVIGIDLGTVISARRALTYDPEAWLGEAPDVQPDPEVGSVIVEYTAHPRGRLYVATGLETYVAGDLPDAGAVSGELRLEPVEPATRLVTLRVVDQGSAQPVPVRIHLHGEAGEYLPPRGHHRRVNRFFFEDNSADFVNGRNQYAYIDGQCVVDLPLGRVYVEISRGYEVAPVRTVVEVGPETATLTFELERRLQWRERSWVTADTHVHFLSPQTALLEGKAEDVNVVNLLASQWGELFTNVGDFDGRTTFGARDFGGDGEFLVRVGTENRMQVLGHISLLGYSGPMIQPLCTGGPEESALGDPQEVMMAEWAQRCIDQGGLVVLPHGPNPNGERAADIVLGLIHAIEMMTFNPCDAQINPFGLADWYRYQNLGYQIPLCGGSDKMTAASLLGGIRTYVHLGEREFTYQSWLEAMRAGNTFVTVGPLIEFMVEGKLAGSRINLPSGGKVQVVWHVESVRLPIEAIEVIAGGRVVEEVTVGGLAHCGAIEVPVKDSTWLALRVRGSHRGRPGDIAAHSSAVQVMVEGSCLFSETDAATMLEQIEGTIAYVDTIAPRPEARRYLQLRATLESAHNRLHNRLHAHGLAHRHTPLHRYATPKEH